MRAPTQEQKAKEAAILYTYLADIGIVLLTFFFAILTLSLSLIGELLRMALMMVVDFYSFFILRAVHRHQLRRFRFGIGKVEQICHLAIGTALVVGGFWVAHRVRRNALVRADRRVAARARDGGSCQRHQHAD